MVVKVDVMENPDKKAALENAGGEKLMADWGGAKSGLPFYVFLNQEGKKLADSNVLPGGQNIGYPAAPQEIAAFEKLLTETAPKMKAADRGRIVAYLRKVAPAGG